VSGSSSAGQARHADKAMRAFLLAGGRTGIRHAITATGIVSAATLGHATSAPHRTPTGLQPSLASLPEATAELSAATGNSADDPSRGDGSGRPLPGNRWPDAGEVS
jgi:hypothetical protein